MKSAQVEESLPENNRPGLKSVLYTLLAKLTRRRYDHFLQHDSPVAFAARDALAVEIFKQRNRVLTRDAREILECRDIDRSILLLRAVIAHSTGLDRRAPRDENTSRQRP